MRLGDILCNKNTWTIILSSGAKTPVKQFRLPKLLFYLSICIVSLLAVVIAGLSYFYQEIVLERDELIVQLEKRTLEVEEVKQEYIALQQETLSVQRSIEEFKIFEERISNLNLDIPSDIISRISDGSGGIPYPEHLSVTDDISLKLLEMKTELPFLIQKFEETLDRLAEYEDELRTIPTIFPAEEGRITSHFGNRKDPFNWKKTFHSGTDIAAPLNTPIFAAADGTVILAERNGGYGLTVIIEHGNTYETLYAHLNRIDVKAGDQVKKGDVIGGMGTTGRSTGVHLHYEIKRDHQHIDPYLYMTFHERKIEN